MLESIFAMAFILSGVNHGIDLSLGMAAQTKEGSPGQYQMADPIGEVRIETKPHQYIGLFAQHLSSIPDQHDQNGLNIVGAEFTVHIGGK